MYKPIRLGIIGAGWVTTECALPALAATAGFAITAIFDADSTALERALTHAANADVATSIDELIAMVDAVYIATPTPLHAEIVKRALIARRHVLCEKPLALNRDEATQLHALAKQQDVHLATAFNQRFHPAHSMLRELIIDGGLGEVLAVRLTYCCWTPLSRDDWRTTARPGGGSALLDLAPHGLDLARFILGDDIVELYALKARTTFAYSSDDAALISGRLLSDALLQQHVAYNWAGTYPRRTLDIVGRRAMVCARNTLGQDAGGEVKLWRAGRATPSDLPFDTSGDPFAAMFDQFHSDILARPKLNTVEEVEVVDQIASLLANGTWARE